MFLVGKNFQHHYLTLKPSSPSETPHEALFDIENMYNISNLNGNESPLSEIQEASLHEMEGASGGNLAAEEAQEQADPTRGRMTQDF